MPKIDKHIEIVRSSIKRLSSMSQSSCEALQDILAESYTDVSVTTINNLSDVKLLLSKKPDLVFLGLQFVYRHDVEDVLKPKEYWVSDYLEAAGIPYTGSPKKAMALEGDKSLAKKKVKDCGLNTSDYCVFTENTKLSDVSSSMKYPLFVKPLSKGGGVGVDAHSIVNNDSELENKVQSIRSKYGSDSLIENYLDGREFSVAVLKNIDNKDYFAMPLELIAPENENGARILSQSVKNKNTEAFLEVAEPEVKQVINDLALGVFQALGARDYGRIDIRMDSKGVPYFMEANLIPSLIEGYGSFPKASLLNEDMDFKSVILNIVDLAFVREKKRISKVANQTAKLVPSLA